MDVNGMRWSSTYSSSGLPRDSALPMTTRSGRGSKLRSPKGSATGMPSEWSRSDMGGYAAWSEPVTRWPSCCSKPASDAMAVPQIPIRWMCLGAAALEEVCVGEALIAVPLASHICPHADGRFQHPQLRGILRSHEEACPHAERQRDARARDVAGAQADRDRASEVAQGI